MNFAIQVATEAERPRRKQKMKNTKIFPLKILHKFAQIQAHLTEDCKMANTFPSYRQQRKTHPKGNYDSDN